MRFLFLLICGVLLLGAPVVPASDATGTQTTSLAELTWPEGDALAGRQAFLDLKCYQCHAVPAATDLAALNEDGPGPVLTSDVGNKPRLHLLVQIVAPGSNREAQASHMGNFSESMTVAQLTDLIAWLESMTDVKGS